MIKINMITENVSQLYSGEDDINSRIKDLEKQEIERKKRELEHVKLKAKEQKFKNMDKTIQYYEKKSKNFMLIIPVKV